MFVGALVDRFPDLMPLLHDHLEVYDELLTHVFMADVTQWAIDLESRGDSETLTELLEYLEGKFRDGSAEEREIVGVSFVENLPDPGEPGRGLVARLGPTLREQRALLE